MRPEVFKEELADWTRRYRCVFILEDFIKKYEFAKEVIECLKMAKIKTNNFDIALEPEWTKVICKSQFYPGDITLQISIKKNRNYPSYHYVEKGLRYNFVTVMVHEDYNGSRLSEEHWWYTLPIDLLELKDEQ